MAEEKHNTKDCMVHGKGLVAGNLCEDCKKNWPNSIGGSGEAQNQQTEVENNEPCKVSKMSISMAEETKQIHVHFFPENQAECAGCGLLRTTVEQNEIPSIAEEKTCGHNMEELFTAFPMGVSQWKNHGIINGYWAYFLEAVRAQCREELLAKIEDYLKKLCWTEKDIEYFKRMFNQ